MPIITVIAFGGKFWEKLPHYIFVRLEFFLVCAQITFTM